MKICLHTSNFNLLLDVIEHHSNLIGKKHSGTIASLCPRQPGCQYLMFFFYVYIKILKLDL